MIYKDQKKSDRTIVLVFQPPPPGYMPTAAQQAVMQGRPVVATQQKAGWFSGSGGGYTWGGL